MCLAQTQFRMAQFDGSSAARCIGVSILMGDVIQCAKRWMLGAQLYIYRVWYQCRT